MIEQFPPVPDIGETRLLLRPNRASSGRQLGAFFALLSLASGAIAGLSWWQGNVFAPAFALLSLAAVALALRRVWRRDARIEVVAVAPDSVAVRQLPELTETFRSHPMWVRLEQHQGRVCLCSRGRWVEIGSFLGADERARLAQCVTDLLAEAVGPRRTDTSEQLGR